MIELMGWSQSEAARQLYITQPHVSEICGGKTEPSAALLRLFKLTVAGMKPDLVEVGFAETEEGPAGSRSIVLKDDGGISEAWSREVIEQLGSLEKGAREKAVEIVRLACSLGPKRKPVKYRGKKGK